jgi:hypothetical protein
MTSQTSSGEPPDLPPYLRETEPLEIEDLPLQVSLLTMELAVIRPLCAELQAQIQWLTDRFGSRPDG